MGDSVNTRLNPPTDVTDEHRSAQLYPGGYVRYAFAMPAVHDQALCFRIGHPEVSHVTLEVVPTESPDGPWQMTIHVGQVASIEAVQLIADSISDHVFDIVAVTLNIKINGIRKVGFGLTPRQGEGAIAHLLLPGIQVSGTLVSSVYVLRGTDIQQIEDASARTHSPKKKSAMKLFRAAVANDEPVAQFLVLYLSLTSCIQGKGR